MFNPLHSISNQELFWKHLYNLRISKLAKEMVPCPNFINYHLKSEVSIALCCRLCSTRYTAKQIKNCLKGTSAIKIATMKNTDDFRLEGKPSRAHSKLTPFPVKLAAESKESAAEPLVSIQTPPKIHFADKAIQTDLLPFGISDIKGENNKTKDYHLGKFFYMCFLFYTPLYRDKMATQSSISKMNFYW